MFFKGSKNLSLSSLNSITTKFLHDKYIYISIKTTYSTLLFDIYQKKTKTDLVVQFLLCFS
jgi:hypothetical protein